MAVGAALLRPRSKFEKPPVATAINYAHPLARNLVGAWLMNDGGGGKVKNLAQPGLGDGSFGTATTWTTARFGNGVHFDGSTNSPISLGNSALSFINSTDPFTFSIWKFVEPGVSAGTYAGMAYIFPTGASFGWSFVNGANGDASYGPFSWGPSNIASTVLVPSVHLSSEYYQASAGVWTHIIVTGSAGMGDSTAANATLYVNGSSRSVAAGGAIATHSQVENWFGWNRADGQFQGRYDNIALWKRVISADEAAELYIDPFAFYLQPKQMGFFSQGAVAVSSLGPFYSSKLDGIGGGGYFRGNRIQ